MHPLSIGAVLQFKEGVKPVAKWMGGVPTHCDKCNQPLVGAFVDGRTPWGQWGCFCLACVKRLNITLGTGKGQQYDLTTLEKVAG